MELVTNWDYDDFVIDKTLDSGVTATVYLVTDKDSENQFAMKVVKKNRTRVFKNEVEILSQLNHPNVIKLWGSFTPSTHTIGQCMILEYCSHGSLYQYLKSNGKLTEVKAATYIKEIVTAIDYCHSQGVTQRDLKLENILLSDKSDKGVKICDFGLSINQLDNIQGPSGTLIYRPPEIFLEKVYDHRCDIWPIGIILYELLVGSDPFTGCLTDDDCKQMTIAANFTIPPSVSDTAADLINQLLKHVEERITLEDILKHDWLVNMTREG